MKVPISLSEAFGPEYEKLITDSFAPDAGLQEEIESLNSNRYVMRSIVPHIQKLSQTFQQPTRSSQPPPSLWKMSSNPKNLRLSYFLYFFPSNIFRYASIIAELSRLGYQWPHKGPINAIEFGSGLAEGACGIATGEKHGSIGLPQEASWSNVASDKTLLKWASFWNPEYFRFTNRENWQTRNFHKKN